MRVKMRTRYASDHGTCEPGKLIDLSDDEAADLIEKHYAEPVDAPAASKGSQGPGVDAAKGDKGPAVKQNDKAAAKGKDDR